MRSLKKINESVVYILSLGIRYIYFPLMQSIYECYYSICDDDSSDGSF